MCLHSKVARNEGHGTQMKSGARSGSSSESAAETQCVCTVRFAFREGHRSQMIRSLLDQRAGTVHQQTDAQRTGKGSARR